MVDWRPRVLSSDSLGEYERWLDNLASDEGSFHFSKIDPPAANAAASTTAAASRPGTPGDQKKVFTSLNYKLDGQGTLAQLVTFMDKFYLTGYLHQIRSVEIKPVEKSTDIHVTLIVEILSLTDQKPTGELPTQSKPLKSPEKTLAEYLKTFADRNPFAEYVQQARTIVVDPGPKKAALPTFEFSKYAYLSGIIWADGDRTAIINDRTTSKIYYLHPGQTVRTQENYVWTVGEINDRSAIFKRDGIADRTVKLNEPLTPDPIVLAMLEGGREGPARRSTGEAVNAPPDPRGRGGNTGKGKTGGGRGGATDAVAVAGGGGGAAGGRGGAAAADATGGGGRGGGGRAAAACVAAASKVWRGSRRSWRLPSSPPRKRLPPMRSLPRTRTRPPPCRRPRLGPTTNAAISPAP